MLSKLVACIRRLFVPKMPSDDEIDAKLIERRDSDPKYRDLDPVHSIVDLLKLFDLESDPDARALIWRDLGMVGIYTGSKEQNVALIGEFRKALAKGDLGLF